VLAGPSPAYHYQQSTHQHRSRCALYPDRRRVHDSKRVHQHRRASPQGIRLPRQRSRAPHGYPEEHVAHEQEYDDHQGR
jgi:hypothetical protein